MRLRPRRRDLAAWSLSTSPSDRYGDPRSARLARPPRTRRIRRLLRIGALVTLVGAVQLARGAQYRWRPLLAGAVLTATGLVLRGSAWGVVTLPGLYFFWYAVLIPARSEADRKRHSEMERELAGYSTAAQRCDLLATLDRYPDEVTYELRDILASQAVTACGTGIPGTGPR
jgi:hypothetical protein